MERKFNTGDRVKTLHYTDLTEAVGTVTPTWYTAIDTSSEGNPKTIIYLVDFGQGECLLFPEDFLDLVPEDKPFGPRPGIMMDGRYYHSVEGPFIGVEQHKMTRTTPCQWEVRTWWDTKTWEIGCTGELVEDVPFPTVCPKCQSRIVFKE